MGTMWADRPPAKKELYVYKTQTMNFRHFLPSFVLLTCLTFPQMVHGQSCCVYQPDSDGDGHIGVNDLTAFLGMYATQIDSDGDCLIDAFDTCPGPTIFVPEHILPIYDSVYVPALEGYHVFQAWADTTFVEICPEYGCTDENAYNYNPDAHLGDSSCVFYGAGCLDGTASVYFDGQSYDVVTIGDRCWFAENLMTKTYSNGDDIPFAGSDEEFWNAALTQSGVYCHPGGIEALSESYGHMYTSYTAQDPRGLCPAGWRIPSNEDFRALERFVGMPEETIAIEGWRGTNEAQFLKSSAADTPPWNGTNDYGFSWTRGGWRNVSGVFGYTETLGLILYTDSVDDERIYRFRQVGSGGEIWAGIAGNNGDGRSVRCVQIEEGQACEDLDGDGICPEDEVSGCSDEQAYNYNPESTEDGPCLYPIQGCTDGTQSVNYLGEDYNLVTIGDQCWFAENLRAQQFANGDSIPFAQAADAWFGFGANGEGAWCYAFNDSESEALGLQYNFYTVTDDRGVCPAGWHVPTEQDWQDLEFEMGLEADSLNAVGWRGEGIGTKLKASSQNALPWNGNNLSGFGATPSSHLGGTGNFLNDGVLFWTSTPWSPSASTVRQLDSDLTTIRRSNTGNDSGCVIRCLKDE